MAIRIVRSAVDRGINFMDNCWDYHLGESEKRMGAALRDGYRQKVFLMTKFDGRTKDSTARQIDESLQRLQTDHIDLIQYHENIRLEDPDRFFAANGPIEALMDAKKAGKIRYIGFTGHKDPLVHLRMLDVAAQHNFHFDTCQMPLNLMDAHFRSFERMVLPRLVDAGHRRSGNEIDGRWQSSEKRAREAGGMPALRAEPAHLRGDHRLRKHGHSRSGHRGRAHIPAVVARGSGGAARQDEGCGDDRGIRALQDHAAVRRHGSASPMDVIRKDEIMTSQTRLGFIGLGHLGSRIARRLVTAGFPTTVYNRDREKTKDLAALGADVAPDPRKLADRVDVVLSCLADRAAVESVYLGSGGVLRTARPGTVIIEMSTVAPETSQKLFHGRARAWDLGARCAGLRQHSGS